MRDDLYDFLYERRLLKPSERPQMSVELGTHHALAIHLVAATGRRLYIKASSVVSLEGEYAALLSASECVPEAVPKLLGYGRRGGFDFLACEGYSLERISGQRLMKIVEQRPSHFARLLARLGRVNLQSVEQVKSVELLDLIDRTYGGSSVRELIRPWLTTEGKLLVASLPKCVQHSDLTVNNIGMHRDNILLFDFEDYGKVSVPGFDLFTLLASSSDFNVDLIREMMGTPGEDGVVSWYSEVIECYCREVTIAEAHFRTLIPLYLIAFAALKSSYGSAIRAILESVLEQLCKPGVPVPNFGERRNRKVNADG